MVLYNTLTKKKEEFSAPVSTPVKLYVCGITPYDTTHLGHAFTYLSFDVLIRYLQFKGYSIEYAQNVTDIDDDILKRAKKEKRDWQELGEFWTKKFLRDMKALHILPPTYYVKATDSIETIILIVKSLIAKGHAYENQGNVYFRIASFKNYGKLSKFSVAQMLLLSQERGANPNDPLKEQALDFLLWQKSKPQEPSWKSPWGKGRPGWHIECSSMVYDYLGETIEIHGGGHDLIFPHHESEIAQSESFTDKKPFVTTWMHTAMVLYQGEKMSKSLGNLIMISDLLKHYSANAIRFVLLSHHYRLPWEFDEAELVTAQKLMDILSRQLTKKKVKPNGSVKQNSYLVHFKRAMEDDLDTPAVMQLISKLSQKLQTKDSSDKAVTALEVIFSTLGFTK